MKLRNHILLWLLAISLAPLMLFAVLGARYSQQAFLRGVDTEMLAELDRLAVKLDEAFAAPRRLLEHLGASPTVRDFGRSLLQANQEGALSPGFLRKQSGLEEYFVGLQQLAGQDAELRLLDAHGHTIIKASFGRAEHPRLESLLPYPISEHEPEPGLLTRLKSLPGDEVSHLRLPFDADQDRLALLPDSVLPVTLANHSRIYLALRQFGGQLDKLLALAPRLRNARLTLIDPEPEGGQGPILLYDDATGVRFGNGAFDRTAFSPALRTAIASTPEGVRHIEGDRLYLREYTPFTDRLSSWLLVARLDQNSLLAPFRQAQWRMAGLIGLTLALSLLIAWYAARRLARPICQLAGNLRAYAGDQPLQPDFPALSSEVGALQRAFREMIDALEESRARHEKSERQLRESARLASLGEMAAGIGHELNNPLTNMLSLARLIRRDLQQRGASTEDIDSLVEEVDRASRIVSGILNFSRQVEPEIRPIALRPWLYKCVARMEEQALASGVELDCRPGEDAKFRGDPFQLEQVLINLLANAIQASPRGGVVKVRAITANGQLVIQVIDAGEGIDPAIEERLFEPFFTTREVGVGNGLGLSISMGIVQMHGGALELRNNPGPGCTAEIRLPL
ncbi:MAG TPA: HAMP domain-containing histidine kinase [Gammaproteobacteria bacterium]|nr:HAMP domain-containing histidine kinase [Gammaproteobacteria bacterium]